MFGSFGATEIILIVLVLLLLFGGKKIPELMRGLGTGMKEFKKATNGIEEETSKLNEQAQRQQDQNVNARSSSEVR